MTMPTKFALPQLDPELLLDCVHCGLCTASCPTYVETLNEAEGPRGRIYLMRQVIEGTLELDADVQGHLDHCLNCRACETACPSGVQYGKLIEPFREQMAAADPGRPFVGLTWLQKQMLLHIFPSRRRTKLALAPARLADRLGVTALAEGLGVLKLLPPSLRRMQAMLPRLGAHPGRLPEVLPAYGKRRARVGLFLGCVADALDAETNHATAEVLRHNGVEVWTPPGQVCCGALHYHLAQHDPAAQRIRTNAAVFAGAELEAVITNAAGCGAMLKECAHVVPNDEAVAKLQAKSRDVCEFLDDLGLLPPPYELRQTATYHDACHLRHAQRIYAAPRQLLNCVRGLNLVPLAESELCCGAAGSYNLTQPDMAGRLGDRKAEQIRDTGASVVYAGNIGCLMQVRRHLKTIAPGVACWHPVHALLAGYTGVAPPSAEPL